jgi:hypothetical protein
MPHAANQPLRRNVPASHGQSFGVGQSEVLVLAAPREVHEFAVGRARLRVDSGRRAGAGGGGRLELEHKALAGAVVRVVRDPRLGAEPTEHTPARLFEHQHRTGEVLQTLVEAGGIGAVARHTIHPNRQLSAARRQDDTKQDQRQRTGRAVLLFTCTLCSTLRVGSGAA